MKLGRADAIGAGFAFCGAAFGAFVLHPMIGGPTAVFSAVGAGLGWGLAKGVIRQIDSAELARREAEAAANQAANDAEFAQRLREQIEETSK